MHLPSCKYRVATTQKGVHFCQHRNVHSSRNLVEDEICYSCIWHNVECPNPIPVPEKPLEQSLPQRSGPPTVMPSLFARAWNLTQSLIDFTADGFETVTKEQYEQRLSICEKCDRRRENYCVECGCYLSRAIASKVR